MKELFTIKEASEFLDVDEKLLREMRKRGEIHEPKVLNRKHVYTKEWLDEAIEKMGERFIAKANSIWHNKYNYDYVNFDGMRAKVSIECPDHGFFKATPNEHSIELSDSSPYIYTKGCPRCKDDEDIKNLYFELNQQPESSPYEGLNDLYRKFKNFDLLKLKNEYEKKQYGRKEYKRISWENYLKLIGVNKLLDVIYEIFLKKWYFMVNSYLANMEYYVFNSTKKVLDEDFRESMYSLEKEISIDFLFSEIRHLCEPYMGPNALNAIYDRSLPIQATKKNKENPINIIYIWEALDFKGNQKVIKIGTTRSYRGMNRIEEVAETWNTRYKLLKYEVVDKPLELESQLLCLGKKYFTEQRLSDGATEFRIITENDLKKIFLMVDAKKIR